MTYVRSSCSRVYVARDCVTRSVASKALTKIALLPQAQMLVSELTLGLL